MAYTRKTNRKMRPYKMRTPVVTLGESKRELAARYEYALDKDEPIVTIQRDTAFTILRKLRRG